MVAHDLAQGGEIGRAAGGGVEDGGDLAEVVGAENAGGDDRERLGVDVVRAGADGVELIVAAVIGPNSSVLANAL